MIETIETSAIIMQPLYYELIITEREKNKYTIIGVLSRPLPRPHRGLILNPQKIRFFQLKEDRELFLKEIKISNFFYF